MVPRPLNDDMYSTLSNRDITDIERLTPLTHPLTPLTPKTNIDNRGDSHVTQNMTRKDELSIKKSMERSSINNASMKRITISEVGSNDVLTSSHDNPMSYLNRTRETGPRALHKVGIGGPSSSFVTIVRVPSSSVVGIIHNPRVITRPAKVSHMDDVINQPNFKKHTYTQTLKQWLSWEEQNMNNEAKNNYTENYTFQPILALDERDELLMKAKIQSIINKKKSMKQMPVIEIIYNDDATVSTVSSMGYDGSEHDLEALFDSANVELLLDEMREPEDMINYEAERNYFNDDEIRQSNNAEVEALERDPDLSVTNSSIEKYTLKLKDEGWSTPHKNALEKDPDLSLCEADEHIMNTPQSARKEIHFDTAEAKEKPRLFELNEEKNEEPPPLSEIYIPVCHGYGYGFYLKPVTSLYKRPEIEDVGRLKRIRQLIEEGRKRRSSRTLLTVESRRSLSVKAISE